MHSLHAYRSSSSDHGVRVPPLLRAASLGVLLGFPCLALAQDAVSVMSPNAESVENTAIPEATPTIPAPTLEEEESVPEAPPSSLAPLPATTFRLYENLSAEQGIRRHYTRVTTRDTSIRRRQRTHELQDRVREDLDVELRFGQSLEDPSRMDVRVFSSTHSSPQRSGPLKHPIPEGGLALHCWQVDFDSLCREVGTQKEVEWPQWAILDFSPWMTGSPIHVGTRWRRVIPDIPSGGWTEGHNAQTRAVFEVLRTNSQPDDGDTLVEAVLETEGELIVYGEPKRFPVVGKLEFEFDHATKLIDRFLINWKGDLQIEGTLAGEAYRWERRSQVRLLITSSFP